MTRVLFVVALCSAAVLHAAEPHQPAWYKLFGFKLLWAGSWEDRKSTLNRAEALLNAPFGFLLRAQALDKRPVPPWNDWTAGSTDAAGALYQHNSGSRLIAGRLETWGLGARTRNIWQHGAPWFEAHRGSNADLRTTPSQSTPMSVFASLGTPFIDIRRFFAALPASTEVAAHISSTFNGENKLFLQGDALLSVSNRHKLRFEWLTVEKTLPKRAQSAWFSEKTSLPEREMRFFAFNTTYAHPFFGFSADFAHSEVFALGKDFYLNGAVRIGKRPWRLSLALDGAGARYAGENGAVSGAGLRTAAKFEWFGKRLMRIAAETRLRSAGVQAPFDRSESKLSYSFPLMRGFFITPVRTSLTVERNGVDPACITDRFEASLVLKAGTFRPAFKAALTETTQADWGDPIIPYPIPINAHHFESFKAGAELSFPIAFVTLKGTLLYRDTVGAEPVWEKSFSAAARGKWGRVSVKLFNDVKDDSLRYSFSWRCEFTLP